MNDIAVQPNLFDRTLGQVRRAFREISTRRGVSNLELKPDLPENDQEKLLTQMRDCLNARGGEVMARARAANLGRAYMRLNSEGRQRFLRLMATRFDTDHDAVDTAIAAVQAAEDMPARKSAEAKLREALRPPRTRLFTQFNDLPDGVKFLVDMRAELLTFAKDDRELMELQEDLRRLLASWFDVGFLELHQITWEEAPAALLEKLIAYEAVHEIKGWDDLKNRLDSDRRCYAFFHPRMPHEPLIFVEVALVNGIADSVQHLLDQEVESTDPETADTAIFYSISNAQRGLDGIGFGDFLIKRVVADLSDHLKNLKTFATLSPIPGFGRWFKQELEEYGAALLLTDEREALAEALDGDIEVEDFLKTVLVSADWAKVPALTAALKPAMMRLAATYLYTVKRGLRAADPVANFHLSNGARMERLNWMADTSARGMRQSAGLMINYLYKLDDIDSNHEGYKGEGTIAVSSSIRNLAKKSATG